MLFGIWKHGVCRVPLSYTPMLEPGVSLGMYALASLRLSLAGDFPLHAVSLTMIWVALAAWPRRPQGWRRGVVAELAGI